MTSKELSKKNKVKRVSTTTRIKKKPLTIGQKRQLEIKTRSGFESKIVDLMDKHKVNYEYENKEKKVEYTVPEKSHRYLCDFIVPCRESGLEYYFEAKGYIPSGDLSIRMKYVYVQEQNPSIKLVMVFQNPSLKITKNSKTTYKMWFESKGITCIDFKQLDKLMAHYNKTDKIDLTILDY